MRKSLFIVSIISLAVLGVVGCGGSNNGTAPLAAFQPEIINVADAFQFQATNVENVTTIVSYPWSNSLTQATINHSSVLTGGTATVSIFDNDSTLVYTSGLVASLNEASSAGTAGTWYVTVQLVNVSGTLNFRVESL